MELKDENEKKILEEKKSETSNFTEYTLKEEREKTKNSDNDNSDVQSKKEQQNLRKLSTRSTKATNWSMQMLGEHNILKSMKEYLLEHPDLIAIRGNMDNIITNSQSQKMCIMLKFIRPITKTTIYKLVHECPSLPSNVNVTIDAVTKPELVKEGLDKISQNTEDREPFEKGDYTYSRFSKDKKVDPSNKIAELGLHKARLWWASNNLPFKDFIKAEAQYNWVQNVKRSKYATSEEDTKIDPMSKIQELGLLNAKQWWAEKNLPYKEFKNAETQYNWGKNVKKQAELAKESDQEKKIDPMSKIIELGLSEARLWWATNHLPNKEFKTAEVQYNWEQDVKREATKLSEKSNEVDPMRKIEEMGVSRAREWWAEHRLPYEEFDKAKAQYNWEEETKMLKKLREKSEMQINKLYPWQNYVYNIFKEVPDTRTIYVVLDKDGGKGKTFFQNMLYDLHPDEVVDIENGNSKDMLSLLKNVGKYKMIQLNLTKQTTEKVNLSAIEKMKDGNFSSLKYVPKKIRTEHPHLFIYTNAELDWNCLTEDRLRIIHLEQTYNDGFIVFTLSQWRESINSLVK